MFESIRQGHENADALLAITGRATIQSWIGNGSMLHGLIRRSSLRNMLDHAALKRIGFQRFAIGKTFQGFSGGREG